MVEEHQPCAQGVSVFTIWNRVDQVKSGWALCHARNIASGMLRWASRNFYERSKYIGSEILPCRGRRVGPCRTCRGETCTGCVCVLRSHLNLAICLCPKYLLSFSWLKSSYSKSDWVLGIQKHLILILFSAITLRNKETEDVELFC